MAEEIFQSEEDRPEKPDNLRPELEPLWCLITKCWQLDPDARPSALEIVDYLESHYSSLLQTESTPLSHPNTVYSIQAATLLIRQVLEDTKKSTSEIILTALAIFIVALNAQIQRENVLTTALMQSVALLNVFKEIKTYFQTTFVTNSPWTLQLSDGVQSKLDDIRGMLSYHQRNLIQAAAHFSINLNIQVVGSIDDLRYDLGNMMDKMNSLANHLQFIMMDPHLRQQKDALVQLVIQMQRGLEYYQSQVTLRNIPKVVAFENQVKLCLVQIEDSVRTISQMKQVPNAFGLLMIASWMLSSDDIDIDTNDERTILGRGGFGTVFRGKYFGRDVAVKHFHQIHVEDSTDLEELIAKEINGWKEISHEPYILTLVGVCTKTTSPILVSELCDNNIRRYIRDWPDMLLPCVYQFAKGLASLHKAKIIRRDLKGDNVLVTFNKTVAIADFGLSRSVTSLENTKTGAKRSGTLNWMSPEQYFTPRSVAFKSDICDHEFEEICKSGDDRPKRPDNLDPALEPLWTLITMCWQLDPTVRPTADEIVDYLKNHFGNQLDES
ncbi:hypothetical protein AC1031_013986 [Aphanomyces cochlioides]|nr:hypothetical protein AC1031_013986 [Aphanomyces cochlioides]